MKLQLLQESDKSWTLKKDGEPVISHKSFKECDEARDRVGKELKSIKFSRDELLIMDDALETALMVYQNTLDEFSHQLSKKDLSLVRCRVIALQALRKRLADDEASMKGYTCAVEDGLDKHYYYDEGLIPPRQNTA